MFWSVHWEHGRWDSAAWTQETPSLRRIQLCHRRHQLQLQWAQILPGLPLQWETRKGQYLPVTCKLISPPRSSVVHINVIPHKFPHFSLCQLLKKEGLYSPCFLLFYRISSFWRISLMLEGPTIFQLKSRYVSDFSTERCNCCHVLFTFIFYDFRSHLRERRNTSQFAKKWARRMEVFFQQMFWTLIQSLTLGAVW